jgi:hypothetical protein
MQKHGKNFCTKIDEPVAQKFSLCSTSTSISIQIHGKNFCTKRNELIAQKIQTFEDLKKRDVAKKLMRIVLKIFTHVCINHDNNCYDNCINCSHYEQFYANI